jgi:alpha-ketoglutarate-dependent taurine dioxygenase
MTTAVRTTDSVVHLDAGESPAWWPDERDAIRAALVEELGAGYRGDELPEVPDPDRLRDRLREVAPALTALAARVRAEFDAGACAVVVERLGVVGDELDEQRRALYTFAATIGDVMANHPRPEVVYDVRCRDDKSGKHFNASNSDREAKYHTDAGYLRIPPRWFLLFASHAATCGGGVSLIQDGRAVVERLCRTEEGARAVAVLRGQTAPREVAANLRDVAWVRDDGFQHSNLLAELPMWRWTVGRTRKYAAPEVAEAITTVSRALRGDGGEVRLTVPTDAAIVIDNHIALHARTAFTDPERNLFRIRFHDPAHVG